MCGPGSKICPPERATELLEAIISPGSQFQLYAKENFHEQPRRSSAEVSNESTHIREHGGCGGGKHSFPGQRRRCTARGDGAQRRPCARTVRRRVILVRGDCTIADSG